MKAGAASGALYAESAFTARLLAHGLCAAIFYLAFHSRRDPRRRLRPRSSHPSLIVIHNYSVSTHTARLTLRNSAIFLIKSPSSNTFFSSTACVPSVTAPSDKNCLASRFELASCEPTSISTIPSPTCTLYEGAAV